MKVADTSVLIDFLRGKVEAEKLGNVATCFPIECELYTGTKMARNTEEGEKQVEKLLQRTGSLEADEEAARKFSELTQKYPEISDFDLMIASICIANGTELMTQDADFEEIEELNLVAFK